MTWVWWWLNDKSRDNQGSRHHTQSISIQFEDAVGTAAPCGQAPKLENPTEKYCRAISQAPARCPLAAALKCLPGDFLNPIKVAKAVAVVRQGLAVR